MCGQPVGSAGKKKKKKKKRTRTATQPIKNARHVTINGLGQQWEEEEDKDDDNTHLSIATPFATLSDPESPELGHLFAFCQGEMHISIRAPKRGGNGN